MYTHASGGWIISGPGSRAGGEKGDDARDLDVALIGQQGETAPGVASAATIMARGGFPAADEVAALGIAHGSIPA